jgi:hypothetical protein
MEEKIQTIIGTRVVIIATKIISLKGASTMQK